MAFILKEPCETSKGIVVFTHKELRCLQVKNSLFTKLYQEIKQHYFIAVHWGHYCLYKQANPIIDFHLAGPGTLKFEKGVHEYHILLCSRNFIPDVFKPMHIEKFWDVINISRASKLKKLEDFLQVIRKAYDKGRLLKVLLVMPALKSSHPDAYSNLYQQYQTLFNEHEKEYFTFMWLNEQCEMFPLPRQTLAYFINASKVFALFSEKEGESRVIAEALMCGVPVLARKNLIGGGLDYLNPENSCLFTDLDQAAEQLISMSQYPEKYRFDATKIVDELSEKASIKKLKTALIDFYRYRGETFMGELNFENLDRTLPGHILSLPSYLRAAQTNDLKSELAAYIYMESLCGRKTGTASLIKVCFALLPAKIKKLVIKLPVFIKSLIPSALKRAIKKAIGRL
ncbi:MAG: hypothetical protein K0Q57_48 [Gammaproteobacteria bacterium]|jgi:glycosyltransferase involved in cell wall biosynthesis|nr:hypothetical protein [Gammaproteobacteria bacterium]